VIRGFGNQSREKSMKEEVITYKTSVLPSPQLSRSGWPLFLLKDVSQADDHDIAWLMELLQSVLASSSWASLKTPARSLQWKGRLGQALSTTGEKTDFPLKMMESPLSVWRVVSSG
jgi:hypothetical protein